MNLNFYNGRYGWDRLSKFIVVIALPLLIFRYTALTGAALIIYALWRSFSKNITGRSNEAIRFENWLRGLAYKMANGGFNFSKKYKNMSINLEERRKYKIVACPECKQKLRLPRGKGKVIATCKKCGHEFRLKT